MAAVLSPSEQKVILRGVSWETYARLVAEHEEKSGTRFTYDEGTLEIMVLSARPAATIRRHRTRATKSTSSRAGPGNS